MRQFWRGVLIAGAAVWPTLVEAACAPAETLRASASPLETRFHALVTGDRFNDTKGGVARWEAMIAAARAEPVPSPTILARSYGLLAWVLEYNQQLEPALAAAQQAEAIAQMAGLTAEPWMNEIEGIYSIIETDLGRADEAAARGARALAGARRFPDGLGLMLAYNALASADYARARYEQSAENYAKATDIAVRCLVKSDPFIIHQMASHAGVLYMLGRSEEALATNERAANWALTNLREDSPVITLTLGNLGVMLRAAGRYPEAEAALRRVVDLEGKYQKDSWYYRAISLSNFASVIDRQGRHREAEALWLKSSEFHKRATGKRDPVQPAYPLRFSADAAQARGDLELALARRTEALEIASRDAAADHPELARARIEYGLTLTLLGRAREGLAVADPAVAVVRDKLKPDDVKRLTAEIDHARIVAAVSGPEAGYALIAPIAARLETRLMDASTSRGDLLRYGPVFSSSFATVTGLALATKREAEAFHWLQLANLSDIVLVNAEVAARAALASSAQPLMRAFQDGVRQRQALDRARSFAVASNSPAEVARVEAEIRANDTRIAAGTAELERAYPAFRSLGRPVPATLEAFRAGLRDGQTLVAPLPLDDGTLTVAVTRAGLTWRKSPMPRWTVAELVVEVRASIDDARQGGKAPFAREAARRLSEVILPPSAGRELLYYASGPLATLPPSLLVAQSGEWLIARHSVAVLPTLDGAASDGPPQGQGFLGIGAPERFANLPPLPQAARELKRMAALLGGKPTLLQGDGATEAAVKALPLARYGTIAVATHALGGGDLAGLTEPALVLGAGGSDDGLLTASEIAGLRLDADWVILSACDTAAGLGAGTPTYSGLASAFMAAGAKALLVSHWPVRDDAAEALTVATLKGARAGLSRAEALRRAMLAVQKRPGFGHPALWAPFVLVER